jgi:hypothetical protein
MKRRYQAVKLLEIDASKLAESVRSQRIVFGVDVAKEDFFLQTNILTCLQQALPGAMAYPVARRGRDVDCGPHRPQVEPDDLPAQAVRQPASCTPSRRAG